MKKIKLTKKKIKLGMNRVSYVICTRQNFYGKASLLLHVARTHMQVSFKTFISSSMEVAAAAVRSTIVLSQRRGIKLDMCNVYQQMLPCYAHNTKIER